MKVKPAKLGYSIISLVIIKLSISIAELLSYSNSLCGSALKARIVIDSNTISSLDVMSLHTVMLYRMKSDTYFVLKRLSVIGMFDIMF